MFSIDENEQNPVDIYNELLVLIGKKQNNNQ